MLFLRENHSLKFGSPRPSLSLSLSERVCVFSLNNASWATRELLRVSCRSVSCSQWEPVCLISWPISLLLHRKPLLTFNCHRWHSETTGQGSYLPFPPGDRIPQEELLASHTAPLQMSVLAVPGWEVGMTTAWHSLSLANREVGMFCTACWRFFSLTWIACSYPSFFDGTVGPLLSEL